ncbi:MAG: sigma-54 interaction domain-containing protein [Janthinobacterium lividum]
MSNAFKVGGNVVGLHTGDMQTVIALRPSMPAAAEEGDKLDLPSHQHDETAFGAMHGASTPMRSLFAMIRKVAPTRASVLITGASGTGKELVAREIHARSRVANKPFIALNCAAVSPQLIEAELFGHERGSFTGAVRTHKGCFERADGGTLFLDELTEMPMDMQVKLLRVLEDGRFCRVGADDETAVRVRVVAATNRDPMTTVEAGLMRADLYYRLAVFPLFMPSLHERGSDIALLAGLFLQRLNQEEQTDKHFSRASRRFMQEYSWPGNVRELKNLVHRAYILADEELDLGAAAGTIKPVLPRLNGDSINLPLGSNLADAEQQLICATLNYCGGNKTQTADVLGVSLKTLYNRLNEYQAKIPGSERHDRQVGEPCTELPRFFQPVQLNTNQKTL